MVKLGAMVLLSLLMSGCLEVPDQELLLTENGERLIDRCGRLPVSRDLGKGIPSSFQVLVWNIHKLQGRQWSTELTADGADLLLLQEAIDSPRLAELLNANQPYWQQMTAFRFQGQAAGVLTASKVDAVYSCAIRYAEPAARIPKSSLISLFPLSGSRYPLLVINLHAINFEPGMAAYKEQLTQLFGLSRKYPGPVLMAGDFNAWNEKRRQFLVTSLGAKGFTEARLMPDHRVRVLGQPLDAVFYRGLVLEKGAAEISQASDHNPIRLRFRYVKK